MKTFLITYRRTSDNAILETTTQAPTLKAALEHTHETFKREYAGVFHLINVMYAADGPWYGVMIQK